jgi:hypothetical protein
MKRTLLFTKNFNPLSFFAISRVKQHKTQSFSWLFMLLFFFLFLLGNKMIGQVTITQPNLSIQVCSGFPSSYNALGNIVITENERGNFGSSATPLTLILTAPTNFEFQVGIGDVSVTGSNLSVSLTRASRINVTATTITITYNCSGTNQFDSMTISGLQVRGTNTASTGNITRTGTAGTGTISGLVNGTTLTNTLRSIAPCYCTPTASSGVDGAGITNVSYSSVNNSSSNTLVYNDYTAQIGNVYQGASMPISVTTSTGNINYNIKIWVDWNNDGDFTDSGEAMLAGTVYSGTVSGTMTVPLTASVGNHRMRVGIAQNKNKSFNETPIPCFTGSKGAYEDYTINVIAAVCTTAIPTVSTNPTDKSIMNNGSTSFTATFANTPTSYIWEVSSDGGTNFTPISNGGVYNGATTSTLTLTSVPSYMTGFKYRVSASNACGTSVVSNTATLTITVTYCNGGNSAHPTTHYISSFVSTGNLKDTANAPTTYSTNGYGDFKAITIATQIPGGGANFSINVMPLATTAAERQRISCFVDWNGDGIFADPAERVYTSNLTSILETTFGFEIPLSANPGNYRLRIRSMRPGDIYTSAVNPCSPYNTGGETEDYTLAVVRDCASIIESVINGSECGINKSVTLTAIGLGGAIEYRWYTTETSLTPIGTTPTGSWTTPLLSSTTTYYVTSYNGSCESLVRKPVIATIIPTTTINFTPTNPTTCGENNVITINATGDTTVIDLFNEDFEGTTYGLTATIPTNTAAGADSPWSIKPNTYSTTSIIWKPAISSGSAGTNFALTSSDYSGANIVTRYATTNTINTTDFIDLKLTFKHYFSHYPSPTINYAKIQVSKDIGNTVWTDVKTYNSDLGSPSKFIEESLDLTTYKGETNLKFRFEYTAAYADGWAVDNIRLYGTKQLYTTFVWTNATLTPIAAYTDEACTSPYNPTTTKVNTIYLKPDLTQLESATFPITISATLGNGCPVSQVITVTNNTRVWKGSPTLTDWNDPNNWKPSGVPTESSCVIIPATTIIPGSDYNAYAKNLTVKSTGNLDLTTTGTLTVTDFVKVDASGIFNIRDKASLIQINETNTNSGTINVEKTTSPFEKHDYTYWSTPVTSTTISTTFPTWRTDYAFEFKPSNFLDEYDSETGAKTPDGFDDDENDWIYAATMTSGKGYIIMGPTTGTFPKSESVVFNGVVNNGVVNTKIFKTPGTPTDDDWNLVGNPYPSAISATAFINANLSSIDATLYFWTHKQDISINNPGPDLLNFTSDDYAMYNLSGGTGTSGSFIGTTEQSNKPLGNIASCQSFFVESNVDNVDLIFNNTMRLGTTNTQFYKTLPINIKDEERDRLWLNMENSDGIFSQQLIGYFTNTTNDYDNGYDGLLNDGGNYVNFYSFINEDSYKIQGRETFNDNDQVRLGYFSAVAGSFNINIDSKEGIFKDSKTNIYLEDKELNIIHDLKKAPYVFNTEIGDFKDRFCLRYTDKTLSVQDPLYDNAVTVFFTRSNNTLNIKNSASDNTVLSASLYDIQGKLLSKWDVKEKEQSNIKIPIQDKSSAVYIVKLKTEKGNISKKIIIK